jgi:DNA transformation protein and related proteins
MKMEAPWHADKQQHQSMNKLAHLANITPEMETKLIAAGIDNPQKLREKGSRNAFMRVKMMDSDACFTTLLSFEGAIRGQLIDELDESVKQDLK